MSEQWATVREAQVLWRCLLDAVLRYTAEAPVSELAEADADRLQAAANNVLIRLQERRDKGGQAT